MPDVTYCLQLQSLMLAGIATEPLQPFKPIEGGYTLDGLSFVVRDLRCGQDYRVEIKPVREHDEAG